MKLFGLIVAILLPLMAHADSDFPLFGIYEDDLNGVNVKWGVYKLREESSGASIDSPAIFYNIEVGENGQKITAGYGRVFFDGMGGTKRAGLAYANIKDQGYIGIETLLTFAPFSLKAGFFHNLENSDDEFILGFGFGI